MWIELKILYVDETTSMFMPTTIITSSNPLMFFPTGKYRKEKNVHKEKPQPKSIDSQRSHVIEEKRALIYTLAN